MPPQGQRLTSAFWFSLYFSRGQIIKCSISLLDIIFPEEKHIYLWLLTTFMLPWREGRRELMTPPPFHPNLQLYINWPFLWHSSCHGKPVIWIPDVTCFTFCFSFLFLPYKMSSISNFCVAFENGKKKIINEKASQFGFKFWTSHIQDVTYSTFWSCSCLWTESENYRNVLIGRDF